MLESFTIELDEDGVKRTQEKTPEMYLAKEDIQAVYKLKEGGLKLQGKAKTDFIFIPPHMEEQAELHQKIQEWKALEDLPESTVWEKLSRFIAIPFLGSMLVVFMVDNKLAVGIAGVVFVALSVWTFLEIRKSKHLDKRVKRASWWSILVILSVLFAVIMKISA